MNTNRFLVKKLNECPNYQQLDDEIDEACWPEFVLKNPTTIEKWLKLGEVFPDHQFVLWDVQENRVAAVCHSVSLQWDKPLEELPESGWDWILEQSFHQHKNGIHPNVQAALSITVHPDYRSQGLSTIMIQAALDIAKSKGFQQMVVPVRPNQKKHYPLTSIDDYLKWTNEEGLPFDAWIRVHVRLGATVLKPCHHSMTICSSWADWEKWTGMKFPQSGQYVVNGALNPIEVNVDKEEVVYVEPNVWVVHDIEKYTQRRRGSCCVD